jgi:hypothetical protein
MIQEDRLKKVTKLMITNLLLTRRLSYDKSQCRYHPRRHNSSYSTENSEFT